VLTFYTIPPTKKLAEFVRYYWVFEGTASPEQPYVHRTFANVCPELLFHYKGVFYELADDNSVQPSFLTGLHSQTKHHRKFIVRQPFGIFGVYLYPYALSALLDTPAIEVTNELPDLYSILKNAGTPIEEQMHLAPDNTARISIINAFLESRLKALKRPEIGHIVRTILQEKGRVNISGLSSQCYLSTRQFERNFKEQSGFAAKTFARIARFYSVVEDAVNRQKKLTDIALDFGYYDQSHFIADFKEFSGFCPKTWLSSRPVDFCRE
jgi:AraC-like DNA-binding protein